MSDPRSSEARWTRTRPRAAPPSSGPQGTARTVPGTRTGTRRRRANDGSVTETLMGTTPARRQAGRRRSRAQPRTAGSDGGRLGGQAGRDQQVRGGGGGVGEAVPAGRQDGGDIGGRAVQEGAGGGHVAGRPGHAPRRRVGPVVEGQLTGGVASRPLRKERQ